MHFVEIKVHTEDIFVEAGVVEGEFFHFFGDALVAEPVGGGVFGFDGEQAGVGFAGGFHTNQAVDVHQLEASFRRGSDGFESLLGQSFFQAEGGFPDFGVLLHEILVSGDEIGVFDGLGVVHRGGGVGFGQDPQRHIDHLPEQVDKVEEVFVEGFKVGVGFDGGGFAFESPVSDFVYQVVNC